MSESSEISYGTNSPPAAALWHGGFGAIPFCGPHVFRLWCRYLVVSGWNPEGLGNRGRQCVAAAPRLECYSLIDSLGRSLAATFTWLIPVSWIVFLTI